MSDAMERWLHTDNQPKPSNHEVAEWVRARCDDLMVSLQIGRDIPIAYDAGVLIHGLMVCLNIGPGCEVTHDVAWRVDVSYDDGATWKEMTTFRESERTNAEQLARVWCRRAGFDNKVRLSRVELTIAQTSEEVPQ